MVKSMLAVFASLGLVGLSFAVIVRFIPFGVAM